MKKLKKAIVLVLVCTILSSSLLMLTGCNEEQVVRVFNWGEYIDESIFDDFYERYGIRVIYRMFQTNEEMYSILRTGGTNFDVIIPSDYMIARMIEEGMLAELNFDNIPNFSLIDPRYKNLEFDPDNRFSVPYMVGTVGLIYNSTMINHEVVSWGSLFDPNYAGMILMFDNPRDAFAIALKYLGYSINTVNEDEIYAAFELLVQQREILQAYVMDQIFDKLESGEAAIGPYYAGDFFTMRANNPDLRFARPKEGTNFFVDAMVVPIDAENKENAEKFINFMTRPDIALLNTLHIRYSTTNAAAFAMLPEYWQNDPIYWPDDEVLARGEVLVDLGEFRAQLAQAWTQVMVSR